MATPVAQRSKLFSNASHSMSSNHEAGFSVPSSSHTTGRNQGCSILPELERNAHLLYIVCVVMWNVLGA